jgi:hypothetical protein
MALSSWGFVRRACAALSFIPLIFAANTAFANTVTLQAQKAVYARDGGLNADPVVNGQFDAVYTGETVYVWRQVSNGVQTEYRTGFDFQLPPEVTQSGVTITSATLHVQVTSETVTTPDVITVNGIPGSGAPFVPADFQISNPVASVAIQPLPCCNWPAVRDFQVASWIQTLVGNSNNHASFTFAVANWGTLLSWKPNATLTIDFMPVTGNSPALSILTPASGLTFMQGDPVTFNASASDVEDGDLAGAIQWSSSKNGPIGNGPSVTTTVLTAGAHVITATIVDSQGNTVSKTINLFVQSNANTPPNVTVLAPTNGATFTQGTVVNFQGIASDPEDGDRTANIQWNSNLNGPIGTGGGFGIGTLAVGAHQITATVKDTAGVTASSLINIVVQAPVNTAPTITLTSPASGASLTTGVSFNLIATANDAEQGNMSSSIQWLLDGATPLASGGNATATISAAGAHTITARVVDTGGLIATQVVNVNVTTAVPPASYCSLRGTTSSYEWIAGVKSGTVNNTSGSDGGYRDYTSVQMNMVSGAATNVVLTPGFNGGTYSERWSVWVDLNHDMTFSANELLVSSSSSTALSTPLTIPVGTAAGPTRMRVALSYGTATPPTCGTFSYGEVEDYTVNIQAPTTPPPSGPTYCASRGTTSAYEFIQQVFVNGATRTTGNNSGYADFTAAGPIPLVRGANNVTLTPGFSSGSYNEQWMVWIDFNKDGVFGNDDWVFGNGGTSTVTGVATVPTTAPSGVTRMRVQMKYAGAATPCETFNYGEVEDYAVQIP